jgi:hypothetical protein
MTFQEGDEVKTVDENTMTTSSDEDISLEKDDEDVKTTFHEVRAPEVKKHLVPMALPGLGEVLGEKKGIQHYSL